MISGRNSKLLSYAVAKINGANTLCGNVRFLGIKLQSAQARTPSNGLSDIGYRCAPISHKKVYRYQTVWTASDHNSFISRAPDATRVSN